MIPSHDTIPQVDKSRTKYGNFSSCLDDDLHDFSAIYNKSRDSCLLGEIIKHVLSRTNLFYVYFAVIGIGYVSPFSFLGELADTRRVTIVVCVPLVGTTDRLCT